MQYAGNQNTTTLLAVEHDVLAVLLAAQSETNVRIRSTGIGVHLQTGMVFGITAEWCLVSERNHVRLRPDSLLGYSKPDITFTQSKVRMKEQMPRGGF